MGLGLGEGAGGRKWVSLVSLRDLRVLMPLFFKRLCSVPCHQCLPSVSCSQVHSVQMLQCPLLPLHHPEEHAPGDKAQVRGGHQRHLPHQPGDLPHVSQGAALGSAVWAGQRSRPSRGLCGHAQWLGTALLCPLHPVLALVGHALRLSRMSSGVLSGMMSGNWLLCG